MTARAYHRTDLIERLMDPESPSSPDGRRRVGENRISCRRSDGFFNPFGDNEGSRGLLAPGDGKGRDGGKEAVTGHHHPPATVIPINVTAGDCSQGISYELTEPDDQPDGGCAPSKEEEIGAGDGSGAIRDQAPEEAYHAEQQDGPD